MNNLYIIKSILSDYTDGMAVIAAPSMERCRELFKEQFGSYSIEEGYDKAMTEFDSAVQEKYFYVIEGVNHDEGIIEYVYGGG